MKMVLLLLCNDIELNPGPINIKDQVKVILLNARSLRNKIPQFQAILSEKQPDIIAISETWLQPSFQNTEIFSDDYQVFRKDRVDRKGGGVLLALKNVLPANNRTDLQSRMTHHNEILVVETICQSYGKVAIIVCYRPPSDNSLDFVHNMRTTLSKCVNAGIEQMCLLGDINLPNVDWNYTIPTCNDIIHNEMCNLLQDFSLTQSNFSPSTVHGNILDVVLSNIQDRIHFVECYEDIIDSDHYVIQFFLDFKHHKKRAVRRTVYNFKSFNYSLLRQKFFDLNLNRICNDLAENVDYLVEVWTARVKGVIDNTVPKIRLKSRNTPPWIDADVRHMSNMKETARRKAKRTNSATMWAKYRHLRNQLKNKVQSKYKEYIRCETEHIMSSPKRAWSIMHTKLKSKNIPHSMTFNEKISDDSKEKAEMFNAFFFSTFSRPQTDIALPDIVICYNQCLSEMYFTVEEVSTLLKSLNVSKASGPDNIPNRILKECADILSPSLTRIFNISFQKGIFPSLWKHAFVTPVHKKDDRSNVKNYRPISLTCVVSKIFERCIVNKIYPHLSQMIYPLQHGFIKGRSTTSQLMHVYDNINSGIENGGQIDAIFLDFAKAFDSVSHQLLIHKLKSFGIHGKLLIWLANYLSDRTQQVVLEGSVSSSLPVISGVPQGSILGPLLFLLYINDLPSHQSDKTKIALYADDAKIFHPINSLEDTLNLQQNLDRIISWSNTWQMKFNVNKCKIITLSRKRHKINFFYNMNGTPLIRVSSITDLGITIQENLNWDTHINSAVKKANGVLWMIKRTLGYSATARAKQYFYTSMVQPIVEYGSNIWSPVSKKNLMHIEAIQRRATKYITNDNVSNY